MHGASWCARCSHAGQTKRKGHHGHSLRPSLHSHMGAGAAPAAPSGAQAVSIALDSSIQRTHTHSTLLQPLATMLAC